MSKATTAHPRSRRASLCPRVKVWLEIGGAYAFGLGICEILQAVDRAPINAEVTRLSVSAQAGGVQTICGPSQARAMSGVS